MKKPIFIAEVKTASPFDAGRMRDWPQRRSFHDLAELAVKHGDWISVHTNPLWGGCFEAIEYVRRLTDKPILAKGIHGRNDDIMRAFDCGANYVLCVDRAIWGFDEEHIFRNYQNGIGIIHELSRLDVVPAEFIDWANLRGKRFLYNRRDLRTGLHRSDHVWADFRAKCKWLGGASTIHVPKNVEQLFPGCDAFIVGSHLPLFCAALEREGE